MSCKSTMLLLVRERGVFDALRFCKKKRISREKRNLGVLGGKVGRFRQRPRSFAGTRGEFGDLSEIFFVESDENAKKNFAFWRLGASFLRILSGRILLRAGTFLGENFFPKNQFPLSEMMIARTKRSKQLSVLLVFSVAQKYHRRNATARKTRSRLPPALCKLFFSQIKKKLEKMRERVRFSSKRSYYEETIYWKHRFFRCRMFFGLRGNGYG